MSGVEQETKLELDSDSFNRLLQVGETRSHRSLLNVYYDHGTCLSDAAATFRIRFFSDRNYPIAQFKLPPDNGQRDAPRRQRELEWEITFDMGPNRPREILVEADLPSDFQEHLEAFGIDRLERIGWLRTERWELQLPNGPAIELDRLTLPNGVTVYEAEIESDDPAIHKDAEDQIRTLIGSTQRSSQSKYERFAEALSTDGPRRGGNPALQSRR